MYPYLLSFSIFLFWLTVGMGIASALRPWRPMQNLLLAPAIGASATVVPLLLLNRAGLPVRSFALWLAVTLLVAGVLLIWRSKPLLPVKAYAPFLALVAVSMAMTGRPLFEFGFDWVSFCNDDMANYVLGAHRFADVGFFQPLDETAFFGQKDSTTPYWFFHTVEGSRPGSELMLAWVISLVGMSGHHLFMPLILAFHGALITAGAAIVYRQANRHRAALATCFLLTFSALFALGTIYQLSGQVFGMMVFCACAALLTARVDHSSTRSLLRLGVLACVPCSAFLIVYPELLPFLGLSVAIHFGLALLRNRAAWRKILIFVSVAGAGVAALLNVFLPTALNFLLSQSSSGLAVLDIENTLFPYYFLPTGTANFFGILPNALYPSEPYQSMAIALGLSMTLILMAAIAFLLRRSEPVAILTVVFLVVSAFFFYRRVDFALYKLAMYIQPFALACLALAATHVLTRKRGLQRKPWARYAVVACAAIFVSTNLFSHSWLVKVSKGERSATGGAFVEIPGASTSGLVRELQHIGQITATPVILMDSYNIVLTKFAGLYFRGRSFVALPYGVETNFVSENAVTSQHGKLFGRLPNDTLQQAVRVLERYRKSIHYLFFDFKQPGLQTSRFVRTSIQMVSGVAQQATLLADAPAQTIINRRHTRSQTSRNLIPSSNADVRNHLAFMPSDLGRNYYTRDSSYVSIFQLEPDYMVPGSTMAGVGRYFVFQVLNPSRKVRMQLDLTATLKGDFENRLPPAMAVGTTRAPFPLRGRGSARVFSEPFEADMIEGQPFVGLDMGVQGTAFPSRRPGLMGLYGRNIPIDRRRLVGFGRNISLVSEEEYERLAPPTSLSQFPRDLLHPDLEYSGFYEDGWTSESGHLCLNAAGTDQVAVRGIIPSIGGKAFRTEASVLVNGKELIRETLAPGTFELTAPWQPQSGRNQVELRFSAVQSLPAPDHRKVSARLNFIGFEDSQTAVSAAPAQSVPDIIPAGSPISLGDKWYPIENFKGERFRWVANDAAFTLSGAGGPLNAEVEAGPGIGTSAFVLKVLDASGATVLSVPVEGRQTIQLRLPAQPGKSGRFRFHVDGGGKRIPQDPRILNFRVFRLEPPAPMDIVCCGIAPREGWHTVETFGGQTFRWVANNARFTVPASSPRRLALEVEPGPGVGSKPFTLKISDSSGRQVHSFTVAGRRKIPVDLPPATYRLHLDGGGKPTPNDPRILNFRVFSITTQ